MRESIREEIKESKNRAKSFGVKVDQVSSLKVALSKELKHIKEESLQMLHVCESVYGEMLDSIDFSENTILVLTDAEGCVLSLKGNSEAIESLKSLNIDEGVYVSEPYFGANAVALAIHSKEGCQFNRHEHYPDVLVQWNTTATPIFNYNNRLIGVVAIFEFEQDVHKHTLSLVKMAARIVGDRLWNKLIQKQLSDERYYAFNIMNNLSYGLFALDQSQKIHWVNDTACRMLNIRRTHLLNKHITTLLPTWESIKKQLDRDEKINDEECNLSINNSLEKYLINSYPVNSESKDVLGYVVTIRPFSRMLKMLGRYSLDNAHFNFKDILGKSEAIKRTIEMAKTAAKSPSTILITGESGTGKEVFAQSIHNSGTRKNNNFVAINCGAISATLIESELFGYEEGAFTGALKKGRPGKFELADNGTLFLDEIGEMPLEMQVKLLRAIQEKRVTRVGGSKDIPIDVRIIAATNKDLEDAMRVGVFRSDLFYRISVIPIHLPSLKERKSDISLLIQHFLKQKGQILSKPIPSIDVQTMQSLTEYKWPGNVRELENVVEKLVLFNGQINFKDLIPVSVGLHTVSSQNIESDQVLPSLAQSEKSIIERTLKACDWNITQAAQSLAVGRNTLYDKIKKYKLIN